MLLEQVDRFLSRLHKCIENHGKGSNAQPQLQMNNLCLNTLKEAAHMVHPNDGKKIAEDFFFASLSRASMTPIHSLGGQASLAQQEQNIQLKLERLFVEVFRDKVTEELKSNLTTTNKKVQKRKIKKLKQKEQQLEREREEKLLQEQKAQQDEHKNLVKVQHAQAIELLIGKQPEVSEPEQTQMTWTEE